MTVFLELFVSDGKFLFCQNNFIVHNHLYTLSL